MRRTTRIIAGTLAGILAAGCLTLTGCTAEPGVTIEPDKVRFGTSSQDLQDTMAEDEDIHYFTAGNALMEMVDSYNGYEVTDNSIATYYTGEGDSLYKVVLALELEDEKDAEKLYKKTVRQFDKTYTHATDKEEGDYTCSAWAGDGLDLQMILVGNNVVIQSSDPDSAEMDAEEFTFWDEQVALGKIAGNWYSIQSIDNSSGEVTAISEDSTTQFAFYRSGLMIMAGNDAQTTACTYLNTQMDGGCQFEVNGGYSTSYQSDLIFSILYADSTPDTIAFSIGNITLYLSRIAE